MPKVYNKYHRKTPIGAVNVMRGTPWGNPFSHRDGTAAKFKVSSRQEAIEEHRKYDDARVLREPEWLAPLKGKDLECCCSPQECHADYLLELANKE